jgi:pimeloyl-ACP methyl ester carboxylesterase
MCDQRLWQGCIQYLPKYIELIHIAIPIENSIEAIVSVLDKQLPKKDINLAGFSLGGYIASAFALKYPERIRKLLLISNMSYSLPALELKERSRTISYLKTHGYSGIPTKRIMPLIHSCAHHNIDIINCIRAMDKTLGKATLIQQLTATTQRENLLVKLPTLTIPIKFLIGDHDTLVKPSRIEAIIEHSRLISLSVLSNTGHMLPLEQPQQCAENMIHFFIE